MVDGGGEGWGNGEARRWEGWFGGKTGVCVKTEGMKAGFLKVNRKIPELTLLKMYI